MPSPARARPSRTGSAKSWPSSPKVCRASRPRHKLVHAVGTVELHLLLAQDARLGFQTTVELVATARQLGQI